MMNIKSKELQKAVLFDLMRQEKESMIKILFVCYDNILKIPGKVCKTNDFMAHGSIYYTTITPFLKEL